MKPTSSKRRGATYRLYRCVGRHGSGDCPEPTSVVSANIEREIEDAFFHKLGTDDLVVSEEEKPSDSLQRLEEARQEFEAWVGVGIAALGKDVYLQGLELRRQALEEAQAAVNAEASSLPDPSSLQATWPDLSVSEKRQLLAAAIDCVMIF